MSRGSNKVIDLGTLQRAKATRMAFAILDSIQDEDLSYTVAALGLVLETVCSVKKLQPSEIMTTASNMLRTTGLGDDNYVRALKLFVDEELPNR